MPMCTSCGSENGVHTRRCLQCGEIISDRSSSGPKTRTLERRHQRRNDVPESPSGARLFGALMVSALVFVLITFVLYGRH
jgi:uncharacterized membrane protein YvbJ